MLWYADQQFADFSVRLQFRDVAPGGFRANSGVFVRFPDPRTPLEQRPPEELRHGRGRHARRQAWVAIFCGHEIQIYDGDTGEPQKTGSVYNFDPNTLATGRGDRRRNVWNDYEIRVVGQHFTMIRNGVVINEFDNTPGKASSRAGDPPTDLRQFISELHRPAEPQQQRPDRNSATCGCAPADPDLLTDGHSLVPASLGNYRRGNGAAQRRRRRLGRGTCAEGNLTSGMGERARLYGRRDPRRDAVRRRGSSASGRSRSLARRAAVPARQAVAAAPRPAQPDGCVKPNRTIQLYAVELAKDPATKQIRLGYGLTAKSASLPRGRRSR